MIKCGCAAESANSALILEPEFYIFQVVNSPLSFTRFQLEANLLSLEKLRGKSGRKLPTSYCVEGRATKYRFREFVANRIPTRKVDDRFSSKGLY